MRTASSRGCKRGHRAHPGTGWARWPAILLFALLLLLPPAVDRAEPTSERWAGSSSKSSRHQAGLSWQDSVLTASGETVAVSVSDRIADAAAVGRRWAEFFATLPHGDELGLLHAVIVDVAELAPECGEEALGCYEQNRLVVPAAPVGGATPEEIAPTSTVITSPRTPPTRRGERSTGDPSTGRRRSRPAPV